MSFVEPEKSNARLSSQEMLDFEKARFRTHFVCRAGNSLDKYRTFDLIMGLGTLPLDSILVPEKDDDNNLIILGFIRMVVYSQKVYLQKMPQEAKDFEVGILRKMYFEKLMFPPEKKKEPEFTKEGERMIEESNAFIQKVEGRLYGVSNRLKQKSTVTHQKDFSSIMNFLNFAHNDESLKVNYEMKHSKNLDDLKKKTLEDCSLFLAQLRIYIVKKVSDESGHKLAPKYGRLIRDPAFTGRRISKFQNIS